MNKSFFELEFSWSGYYLRRIILIPYVFWGERSQVHTMRHTCAHTHTHTHAQNSFWASLVIGSEFFDQNILYICIILKNLHVCVCACVHACAHIVVQIQCECLQCILFVGKPSKRMIYVSTGHLLCKSSLFQRTITIQQSSGLQTLNLKSVNESTDTNPHTKWG